MCVDLLGYDFGPCDAVLGWSVVSGGCVEVSGCESDPFVLFASRDDCEAACPTAHAVPALGLPGVLGLGLALSGLGLAWSRRSTKTCAPRDDLGGGHSRCNWRSGSRPEGYSPPPK
jgi:hypothetical protein